MKNLIGLYKHFFHHSSYVCNWFIPHLQMYSASCLLTSQSVLVIEFILERRDNQNSYIKEEQTTQWPKKKSKRTNNDLQNIHIKLKIE